MKSNSNFSENNIKDNIDPHDESKMLPKVTFLENRNHKVKLRKFTEEELKILEEDGFIVKDNFLGQDIASKVRQEVIPTYFKGY